MIGSSSKSAARLIVLPAFYLALACGCTQELETGYKPHPLNASQTQRRAYYASPFTPEAEEGAKEAPQSSNFHKPGAL